MQQGECSNKHRGTSCSASSDLLGSRGRASPSSLSARPRPSHSYTDLPCTHPLSSQFSTCALSPRFPAPAHMHTFPVPSPRVPGTVTATPSSHSRQTRERHSRTEEPKNAQVSAETQRGTATGAKPRVPLGRGEPTFAHTAVEARSRVRRFAYLASPHRAHTPRSHFLFFLSNLRIRFRSDSPRS